MSRHRFLCAIYFIFLARLSFSEDMSAVVSTYETEIDPPFAVQVTIVGSQTNAIPDPSAADASEPKRIVRYFCRAWKDENYRAMYGAMSEDYRNKVSIDDFVMLFKNDNESNGGLQDENIEPNEIITGAVIRLNVQLVFRSNRIKPRTVVAKAIKTGKGYRIVESGILPIDLNNL